MADHGPKRRAKSPRHEDTHEEHTNHEAWVIPYADMLTLLMALFLVMFAIGRTDAEKFDKLAKSFNRELGGGDGGDSIVDLGDISGASPVAAGDGVLDGVTAAPASDTAAGDSDAAAAAATTIAPSAEGTPEEEAAAAAQALDEKRAAEAAAAAELDALTAVETQLREAATAAGVGDKVAFRLEDRGLVVTIITDQVLFDPGESTLQDGGRAIIDTLAPTLRDVPNLITIEGHTDSRPISTGQFPSNWELSTARATTVLRELIDRHGLDPTHVSASGFGDTRPRGENGTAEGRTANRRVEIVVVSATSGTVSPAG